MTASLARLARLLLGAASPSAIRSRDSLLFGREQLPRRIRRLRRLLGLPRRLHPRRPRCRRRFCRFCRRFCIRSRVAHLYESPTLIRTRCDSKHCQGRGLCSKGIVQEFTNDHPKQEVKKHIASKLPRRVHCEHKCQSCIDNRHAHEPD